MTAAVRVLVALVAVALAAPAAHAASFSEWAPAVGVAGVNTEFQDGCPIESPDGRSLYMASTRPRFAGDLRTDIDIWVAHRAGPGDPWGAPQNLDAPVNSTADDFCPTPVRGEGLFFVSRRPIPGACGGADIYFVRGGDEEARHFQCASEGGPNTPLDEMGPSYVKTGGPSLYFSSGPDLYVSDEHGTGRFGRGEPIAELNSTAIDIQPNVRRDGREIVFASTRTDPTAFGGQDVWVATRDRIKGPWSPPVNLGGAVNTGANETRPSFSWDATRLYFGRAPGLPGTTDIHVATRGKGGG